MNNKYIVKKDMILFDFLKENLSNKSKNNIKSLLTNELVLVNNKIRIKYNFILHKDDEVEIKNTKIKDSKYKKEIKIIYEDKDLIVVNKPANLLCISTEKEKEYTLYHFLHNYVKSKNKNNKIFIIHRLDKETSGLVIFAKNEKTKKLFQNSWNDIALKRCYYAVVENKVKQKEKTIKNYLVENNLKVYETKDKNKGKLSITKYKLLKENDSYSLLDVEILTGRKNQIRVALNNNGNTIVGDKKYNCKSDPIKRIALHAYLLQIKDLRTNKILEFKLDLPYAFGKLVK